MAANKYEPLEPLHDGLQRPPTALPVAQPVATVVATPFSAQEQYFGADDDLWSSGLAGSGVAVRRDWRGGLCQCAGAAVCATARHARVHVRREGFFAP
jgi:hypothetical protein